MSQEDFFEQLATRLKAAGIPFMISGSLASSFYGEPRATNDFDLIIDPDASRLNRFLDSLPPEWYVSREAAHGALARRLMFNVIDTEGAWKADLVIRKDRPFSVQELSRGMPATILGCQVLIVTPEDSILSKLEWSVVSHSQRQYRDALRVAVINRKALDLVYLSRWAKELGLEPILAKLLAEANASTSQMTNDK
ncbi:MAG: hypothetical protein ABSB33_10705 [Tepidisphaeraceae bacterium]